MTTSLSTSPRNVRRSAAYAAGRTDGAAAVEDAVQAAETDLIEGAARLGASMAVDFAAVARRRVLTSGGCRCNSTTRGAKIQHLRFTDGRTNSLSHPRTLVSCYLRERGVEV